MCFATPQQGTSLTRPRPVFRTRSVFTPPGFGCARLATLAFAPPHPGGVKTEGRKTNYRNRFTSPSAWALSYDANVTPSVYYGSGNANGGWTVDTANSIELGLRTHERYDSTGQAQNIFLSNGNGVYGSWTDPATGTPANRSSWNYDFSINVNGTGLTVGDFIFKLYIDTDAGAGDAWKIINPTLISDDGRPGVPYGPTDLSSAYAQNSENALFGYEGITGYNKSAVGTYDFALFAYDAKGDVLAETYMRVNVNGGTATGAFDGNVPDGGTTLSMLGFAMVGLGALRRKLSA